MELYEFLPGNLIQCEHGLVKVTTPGVLSISVINRTGEMFNISDAARIFLSENQIKNVPGYENIGGSVAINGFPGKLKFSNSRSCFEWIVAGQVVREINYLDEFQNLFYFATGNKLY